MHRDLTSDESTLEVINRHGGWHFPDIDLEIHAHAQGRYSNFGNDFDSVRVEAVWERRLVRGDWRIRTFTCTILTSSPTHFHISANLDAYEGDKRVYSMTWDLKIPRDHV